MSIWYVGTARDLGSEYRFPVLINGDIEEDYGTIVALYEGKYSDGWSEDKYNLEIVSDDRAEAYGDDSIIELLAKHYPDTIAPDKQEWDAYYKAVDKYMASKNSSKCKRINSAGVLDRIKDKKSREKEDNVKEAFKDYFENTWKNYKFEQTVNGFDIMEDSKDIFSAYYTFPTLDADEAGIDMFIDADKDGINFTLNPYDFTNTTLEVPFADDSTIFKAVFGFSDEELNQKDDYDKVLKTLKKLTGDSSLVSQFQKDLDKFLEENYDKISKVVGSSKKKVNSCKRKLSSSSKKRLISKVSSIMKKLYNK